MTRVIVRHLMTFVAGAALGYVLVCAAILAYLNQ